MMNSNDLIPIALDKRLLDMGVKRYAHIRPERHPMLLCVGATGTGKSYFISLLMAKITAHIHDSQLYLCDFKNIDFCTFADCERHWCYKGCAEGLSAFYESFQARLSGGDSSKNRKFLVFDEWAAFVLSRTDKKEQERLKSMLSELLMMGRGVQHHMIIGLQRADSQLFPMGGRDNFSAIIALGNISKEQKLMLFPDVREEMGDINLRGQGYLSLDGGLKRVQVPEITDFEKLNAAIRKGLSR